MSNIEPFMTIQWLNFHSRTELTTIPTRPPLVLQLALQVNSTPQTLPQDIISRNLISILPSYIVLLLPRLCQAQRCLLAAYSSEPLPSIRSRRQCRPPSQLHPTIPRDTPHQARRYPLSIPTHFLTRRMESWSTPMETSSRSRISPSSRSVMQYRLIALNDLPAWLELRRSGCCFACHHILSL